MDKRKIIVASVTIILAVLAGIFGFNYTDEDVNKISDGVETITNIVENVEIAELSQEDEQATEVQEANLENQTFEELGEVAYNGSDKTPDVKVGAYKGLTYYSQADKRWANYKYGNNNMLNSGCGPTAAAMVVSSIKGEVLPTTMANLYVKYGYRSANAGTYWAAMKWTADVFDIELKETSNFNTMINKLEDNNYVIAICRNGLFTYGGHFIAIVGIDGDTLKIYDPYLYSGKFNTSTRKKANVKVDGNTVYVSKENFKKYANAQHFYCYKNTRNDGKVNETKIVETKSNKTTKSVNYKVKVTARVGLNIRKGASTKYSKVGKYSYNTTVTVTAKSGNWGKTSKGWICLDYTKKINTTITSTKKVGAKKGLVLRKTANGKKILTIPYNKKVTVLSPNYTTKNGYVWSKVKYGKYTGYVAKKYLK